MGEEEKKPAEEKKMEEKKVEEEESAAAAAAVQPQEIVLKVYMHCEGCARKVRCCLRGFQGVEDVMTDCKSNKVVVKGEIADPLKVLERVQRKSHRQVELLSPIPKPPPAVEDKKSEEKEKPKPEEKKEKAQVMVLLLKVHMHCEACAQEIKKRIQRMKGVESAEPDLKNSEVTVKGVFTPTELIDYVYKRTGKHALIVKQEPDSNKEEQKPKGGNEEEKKNGSEKEKKEAGGGNGKDKKGGDGGEANAEAAAVSAEEAKVALEVKRNELYYYGPRYATEFYAYPPQLFSDENPNACSVM